MRGIIYQTLGSSCVIGIEGDEYITDKAERKQNIIERYYMFWNYAATEGGLKWMGDDFAYFWSDPNRFKKSIFNILEMREARESGLEKSGEEWEAELRGKAEEVFDSLPRESFLSSPHLQYIENFRFVGGDLLEKIIAGGGERTNEFAGMKYND